MKISDDIVFTSRPHESSRASIVRGSLHYEVRRIVVASELGRSPEEFNKNSATVKSEMTRDLIRAIQPRNEFEAAFAELRVKVQSCESLSMGDQMAILNSIADLHEKILLT